MQNATATHSRREPVVALMLSGGRVCLGFRKALFDAANRSGMSVNEYVLQAAAEKLQAAGREFPGIFEPGDLATDNDNIKQ